MPAKVPFSPHCPYTFVPMKSPDPDHLSASVLTPLRDDAFLLSDDQKIDLIEGHVRGILETLGMNLQDDSLRGTPRRVAKMYVKETFG
jgi:GTP cyclohydrolase I